MDKDRILPENLAELKRHRWRQDVNYLFPNGKQEVGIVDYRGGAENPTPTIFIGAICHSAEDVLFFKRTVWRWVSPSWWRYVLDDSRADKGYGPFCHWKSPLHRLGNWIARAACRARGHPAGIWYYNADGLEPDYRCKGCGEGIN